MLGVTVAIQGIEKLRQKLSPGLIAGPQADMLQSAALSTQREARAGAPKDTGAGVREITAEATPVLARVSAPLHMRAMEYGRRPGGRMPPPDALTGWARRHGFPADMEFVLARSIARRGTKGRFFMRRAAQKLQGALPSLLGRMAADIERRWGR